MIIAILAVAIIVGTPGSVPELADQVGPIGAGILVGTLLR
jgi:hypothetical protein